MERTLQRAERTKLIDLGEGHGVGYRPRGGGGDGSRKKKRRRKKKTKRVTWGARVVPSGTETGRVTDQERLRVSDGPFGEGRGAPHDVGVAYEATNSCSTTGVNSSFEKGKITHKSPSLVSGVPSVYDGPSGLHDSGTNTSSTYPHTLPLTYPHTRPPVVPSKVDSDFREKQDVRSGGPVDHLSKWAQ